MCSSLYSNSTCQNKNSLLWPRGNEEGLNKFRIKLCIRFTFVRLLWWHGTRSLRFYEWDGLTIYFAGCTFGVRWRRMYVSCVRVCKMHSDAEHPAANKSIIIARLWVEIRYVCGKCDNGVHYWWIYNYCSNITQ